VTPGISRSVVDLWKRSAIRGSDDGFGSQQIAGVGDVRFQAAARETGGGGDFQERASAKSPRQSSRLTL
jgi:hypothetical protein